MLQVKGTGFAFLAHTQRSGLRSRVLLLLALLSLILCIWGKEPEVLSALVFSHCLLVFISYLRKTRSQRA